MPPMNYSNSIAQLTHSPTRMYEDVQNHPLTMKDSSLKSLILSPASNDTHLKHSSTAIVLDQFYQLMIQLQALQSTVTNQKPFAQKDEIFQINLAKLLDSISQNMNRFVLESYHSDSTDGMKESPLFTHWSTFTTQRQFVHSLLESSKQESMKQCEGLKQIKICLTSQLTKQVTLLKQKVNQHKEHNSINNSINPTLTTPSSSPNRSNSSATSPMAITDANQKQLPVDVIQLHERCVAIHRDIHAIDTQVELIQAKLREFESWEELHQQPRVVIPTNNYKSPYHTLNHSNLKQMTHSSAPNSSRHSSRFSTPAASNMSAQNVSHSSISSAASSNFSHQSTPNKSERDDADRMHMQQLLFSPILPSSNNISPQSAMNAETPRPSEQEITDVHSESDLVAPLFSSPDSSEIPSHDVESTPILPKHSAVANDARSESVNMSAVDLLFEKIWSSSPSQRELSSRRNSPEKSSQEQVDEIKVEDAEIEPIESPTFSILITPASELIHSAETVSNSSFNTLTESPAKSAVVSPTRPPPSRVSSSPIQSTHSTPTQTSGEYYLERAKELAAMMTSPTRHSNAPVVTKEQTPLQSSKITAPKTPIEKSISPVPSVAPSPIGPLTPSALITMQASSPFEYTPIQQRTPSKYVPHLQTSTSPITRPHLTSQTNCHSPAPTTTSTVNDEEQEPSELSILLKTQEARHARHAWMRQMEAENKDIDKLYDSTAEDESDDEKEENSNQNKQTHNEPFNALVSQGQVPASPIRTHLPVTFTPRTKLSRSPMKETEETKVDAPESMSTPSAATRPTGWSQSFHMGSNQRIHELVQNLKMFTEKSQVESPFSSPTPKSSASELMRKIQLMNAQQTTVATGLNQPKSTAEPVKHESEPTKKKEWFDIDEQRVPLLDITRRCMNQLNIYRGQLSRPDTQQPRHTCQSTLAVIEDSHDETESDDENASASSPMNMNGASPLRYSVFKPMVVIKKSTSSQPSTDATSLDPTVASVVQALPISTATNSPPSTSSANKPDLTNDLNMAELAKNVLASLPPSKSKTVKSLSTLNGTAAGVTNSSSKDSSSTIITPATRTITKPNAIAIRPIKPATRVNSVTSLKKKSPTQSKSTQRL